MSKYIEYNRRARKTIVQWPKDVQETIAFELEALQMTKPSAFSRGDEWPDTEDDQAPCSVSYKPLKDVVGRHAMQLTIKHENSYRVIYVAEVDDAVFVLHAFKKEKDGPQHKDYRTAKGRYKQLGVA